MTYSLGNDAPRYNHKLYVYQLRCGSVFSMTPSVPLGWSVSQ